MQLNPDGLPASPPAPTAAHPMRWTLARRIAVLTLALAALATIGGSLWLRAQMRQSLHASFSQMLQDKFDRLSDRLLITPDGQVAEPPDRGGDEFSTIYSGWYWQASGPGITGRSRSLWDAAPLSATAAPQELLQATGPMGEPLLGLRHSIRLSGSGTPQPANLSIFGPARALRASLKSIDRILLTSALLLIALLAIMLLAQVRVGLAPLRRLTQAIAAQRQGQDTPALDTLPLGSDLAPLQRELSALLTRNARVVERARTHAADLNHALKKPLALLSANASRQPQVPAREVLHQVAEMTRLIDRYQARTAGDAQPAITTAAVPVATCLRDLAQAMRKLHAAQALDWQLHLPPGAEAWRWRGDRTDLEEALGNLLDNAGKWAASQVHLSARHDGQALCIDIEDDGPGMSAVQLQSAGQRGLRFDESVQGNGLGLSIASQIAATWGGALALDKSPSLKGLRARLRWPLRPGAV